MGSDLVEKMVGILDMGGEGFDKGGHQCTLRHVGWGVIGRDDGAASITWFVYFWQNVQGGGVN